MEEIELGEYIRTKKDGICKLLEIDDDGMWCGYVDKAFFLRKDNIVKHSKNLIDVIEVGDYINGIEVVNVYESREEAFLGYLDEKTLELKNDIYETIPIEYLLYNKDIKSVLTKEQFEKYKYEV